MIFIGGQEVRRILQSQEAKGAGPVRVQDLDVLDPKFGCWPQQGCTPMSSDPRIWNPKNRQELSTALNAFEGDVIVTGETIRVEVVKVGRKKVRLRIAAPDWMRILRGVHYGRECPPIKPLRSPRPQPKMSGLCLTLLLGDWVFIGDDVFVGVCRFTEGGVIVGFKVPQGMLICYEDVWRDLDELFPRWSHPDVTSLVEHSTHVRKTAHTRIARFASQGTPCLGGEFVSRS